MLHDNINGISIKLVHDTRTKTKKGLYPIKVKVYYRGTSKYYPTGKTVTEDEWKKLSSTRSAQLLDIRNCIKETFELVYNNAREIAGKGEFTFDMLNVLLGRESGGTLDAALKVKIEELNASKQIGTKWYYETILSSVKKFAGSDIPFNTVTVDWLKRYEKSLLESNLSIATIAMRMRGIRTMMNLAKKNGLIKETQYPFGKGKYEIKKGPSSKRALSLEQIAKIARFSCENEEIMFFRDMWMFIYLCNGLNVSDLAKLKYKDIKDNEITFIRGKTQRTAGDASLVEATILPEMWEIINKWGNIPEPENYIFPTVDDDNDKEVYMKRLASWIKKLNTTMKFIGSVTGTGKITSYVARHSFATISMRAGVNVAYISKSLGHSNIKTTQAYLGSFDAEARKANASILTQYKEIKTKKK